MAQAIRRAPNTHVSSYLILKQDNQILLGLRCNTGYCDGQYGFVSGNVEDKESATQAMVREAYEEAGIILDPADLKVVHILHRQSNRLNVDIFFECSRWSGDITNCEVDKCEGLSFFPINALPSNTVTYLLDVLEHVSKGRFYSESGWEANLFASDPAPRSNA